MRPGWLPAGQVLDLMKRLLKRVVLDGLHASGVEARISRSRWRQERALILCYHGVSLRDEHEWNPELYVSEGRLRERFRLLRELGATVLPLGDALRRSAEGSLPPRSVVLTFDDGNADFSLQVVPLLQEFAFSATVYVTTHYLFTQRPVWFVTAKYMLWAAGKTGLPMTADAYGDLLAAPHSARLDRPAVVEAFGRRWSGEPSAAQDVAVGRLAAVLGFDDRALRQQRLFHLMTPTEVSQLPKDLVSVQLHTHRHRQPLRREAYAEEILRNQQLIEGMTGQPARHFCYPSGVVEEMFPGFLRDLGVESAVTCRTGLMRPCTDRWLLPRLVDTMYTPLSTFRAWVAGSAGRLTHS